MGNNVTRTIDKWGVNPKKRLRSKKKKGADAEPTLPEPTIDVHLYDNVPDQPVYAKVNKRKQQQEVELHYAEIQVMQSSQMASRERQRPPQAITTEYATIDFNSTTQTKALVPDETDAADILIPPGALQMPNSKLHRKKGPSAEVAVLV